MVSKPEASGPVRPPPSPGVQIPTATTNHRSQNSSSSFASDRFNPPRSLTPDNATFQQHGMSPTSSVPSRPNSRGTTRNFSRPSTFYKVEESSEGQLASMSGVPHHQLNKSSSSFSAHRQQRHIPPPIISSPGVHRRFSDISDSDDGASVNFYSPTATLTSPEFPASAVGKEPFDTNMSASSERFNWAIHQNSTTNSSIRLIGDVAAIPSAKPSGESELLPPHELKPHEGQLNKPIESPTRSRTMRQPNWHSVGVSSAGPPVHQRTNSTSPVRSMVSGGGVVPQPGMGENPPAAVFQPERPNSSRDGRQTTGSLSMISTQSLNKPTLSEAAAGSTANGANGTGLPAPPKHGEDLLKESALTTTGQSGAPNLNESNDNDNHADINIMSKTIQVEDDSTKGQFNGNLTSQTSNNNEHTQLAGTNSTRSSKPPKICRKCDKPISGQFVRALDSAYHIDCFTCGDCGNKCSAKFFPVDSGPGDGTRIPLCEYDYFRRLDLLCCTCDGPLRGSYITAVSKKYHVEHFKCSVCACVLGPEDTYYEHNDDVLCHYHYSTLHAAKCEGCQTAILKQFVEIYRGGREYQWHPECYMIFKFWNVKLSPPEEMTHLLQFNVSSKEVSETELFNRERVMEQKVFNIWTMLCGYEEATAACISDMLQHASSGSYNLALRATCSLVFNIEVLFEALDRLLILINPLMKRRKSKASTLSKDDHHEQAKAKAGEYDEENEDEEYDDDEELYTPLGREPKTLCKKLVAFMSLVSKARERGSNQLGVTPDLLTLVTSLAHYLKVLLRYGLSNCLQYDRQFPHKAEGDQEAVDSFLLAIEKYQQIQPSSEILDKLKVSAMTTDHCMTCDSSVEDLCIHYKKRQWHMACFICSNCSKPLSTQLNQARWVPSLKKVMCTECAPVKSVEGFIYASQLSQYMVLLKIAVARLQLVLNAFDIRDNKVKDQPSTISQSKESLIATSPVRELTGNEKKLPAPNTDQAALAVQSDASGEKHKLPEVKSQPMERSVSGEKGYMTTLKDIRRLRSTKLDKRVSSQDKKIRRSTILDMPSFEHGLVKDGTSPAAEMIKPGGYFQAHSGSSNGVSSPSTGVASAREATPGSIDREVSGQLSPGTGGSTMQQQQAKLKQAQLEAAAEDARQNHLVFFKRKKKKEHKLMIQDEPDHTPVQRRTTDLFNNEKSLTLDDIPRIVAAEKAREQLPNAFKHRARQALSTEVPTQRSVSDTKEGGNVRYISDLSHTELSMIKHITVMNIYPLVSKWFTLEELFDTIETKKSPSIWDKVGKAFGANRKTKSSGNASGGAVFGQSLELLVEKHGVDSTLGVGPSTLRIPAFVDDCIVSMRQKDMSVEGIFRKNGNIRRLKEYTEKIDKNPDQGGLLAEENPIQLAALLKKFLRELPEPLMTYKLQKLWITAQKISDPEIQRRLLHLTCILLPKIHRDVTEVLFYFLNWVASFSQIDEELGSKMDAHNLATVITPNILYLNQKEGSKDTGGYPSASAGLGSGGGPAESGDAYFLSIESVNVLIEQQQQFAQVPYGIWSLYEKCKLNDTMTTKEIISRYEQVAKGQPAEKDSDNTGSKQLRNAESDERKVTTPSLIVDSQAGSAPAVRPTIDRTNSEFGG